MILDYGPISPYARKVRICAHELGLTDRIELRTTKVAMLAPNRSLMERAPLGRIPVLETDEGQIVFDSTVICEYLDNLAPSPLLFPREPAARLQALVWQALGQGLTDTMIRRNRELMRPEDTRLPALVDVYELQINAALASLELQVGALSAAPFSIGHVAVGVALEYIDLRFPQLGWRGRQGALDRWATELGQRPAFVATRPPLPVA